LEARKSIIEAAREMKKEQIADRAVFKENLRLHLKQFIQRYLKTRPVIITTVVEV
jgi:mRNA degradation ribonuclease J1/J2